MPFQSRVNSFNPPAVEGDPASANPRSSTLAGAGGLVAGLMGAIVGRFHWIAPDFVTINAFADGPVAPDGFLHRAQQALIEVYLQEFSLQVPTGFQVDLSNGGDFWIKNAGPAALTKGASVFAGYADGKAYSSAPVGATGTASLGSTNTAALGSTSTGTAVVGNPEQITISAVTGVLSVGDSIDGTGIPAGAQIVSQNSGTAGGAGVYTLNVANTAAAATITTFGNVLVVSATTGLISVGDTVAGVTGVPAGTSIASQVSGTAGGAGTYTLSAPGTAYFASATGVTTFGSVLKVATVSAGSVLPGMPIATGANLPVTSIESQISGAAGGVGVYQLFAPGTQYVATEAFTTSGGIASGWTAYPTSPDDGAVGGLVKISRQVQ
jgi:hypothetical protein